jgi:hypothetical protein
MRRNARAFQRRGARSVRHKRTWRLQAPLGVSATPREHQSASRVRRDNLIRPPIQFGHRLGIQRFARQDVAWNQRIFARSPWPRSRRQTEKANETTWGGCEMTRWTPDRAGARVAPIWKAKLLQRQLERLGWRAAQRLHPERLRHTRALTRDNTLLSRPSIGPAGAICRAGNCTNFDAVEAYAEAGIASETRQAYRADFDLRGLGGAIPASDSQGAYTTSPSVPPC